jgi:hypothetical protein
VAIAAAFLVSCGGGGGGTSAVPSGSSNSASGGTSKLSMAVTIPDGNAETTSNAARSASGFRSSESVAPSIKGVAVFAYPAGTTMPATPVLVGDLVLNAAGSLCVASGADRACSLNFTAPVGNDTVTIKLYDQEPSGGAIPATANLVATGTAAITVSTNGTNTASLTLNSITSSPLGSGGGAVGALDPSDNGSISGGIVLFTLLAGAVPGSQQVTASIAEVTDLSGLPSLSMQRRPQFVQGAGNTLIYAFGFTLTPTLTLNSSVTLKGTSFVISGSTLLSALTAAPTGTLNIAVYGGTSYTDVGSVAYTFTASTQTLNITSDVTGLNGQMGVTQTGVYILYLPPPVVGSVETPSPTMAPSSTPTPVPGVSPTPTPTPSPTAPPGSTVAKIGVVLGAPNGSNFYPTFFTTDPKLKYLVLGAAAPIQVTVTAFDASGLQIAGSFANAITLTSSSSNFTFTGGATLSAPLSAPGNLTLQYNGSGTTKSGFSTAITANVPLIAPASISAVCIASSSTYEKGQEGNGPDLANDAAGCN